ncbi:MAG TPA: hypothetical protein VGR07_16795 [Thermoanaerobaculia bacterium]|nr:hypothetical protein [Thermoanaerobaculia bacterium]
MNSATLPSFWAEYRDLAEEVKRAARKAYRLWVDNPFHPSLRFKCIHPADGLWSVRVTRSYRALGVWEGDTVTWFWIGSHDEYERFFG